MKGRKLLTCTLLVAVLLLAAGLWRGPSQPAPDGTYALQAPAFVQTAYAEEEGGSGFPEEEAGISAYFQAPGTIDLNDVVPIYRTIEVQTDDYIIGSIAVPDYASESEDVHVYVHADGWVMAYYLADDPVGKLFDWIHYDGVTIETKFDNVLSIVAATIGTPLPSVTYYHFNYPNATDLMLIAEAQYGEGSDSFEVELPVDFTYDQRSWSLGSYGSSHDATYILNGVETYLNDHTNGFGFHYWITSQGTLTSVQLPPGTLHYITATIDLGPGNQGIVFAGLGLVYRVP